MRSRRAAVTAALTSAFIGGIVLLPLARPPQLSGGAHALLLAAAVLCVAGSGLVLLTAWTGSSLGCSAVYSPDTR